MEIDSPDERVASADQSSRDEASGRELSPIRPIHRTRQTRKQHASAGE